MPQFAVDGRALHYETYGEGAAVVLLHGFTSLGSSWLGHGWIEALAGFRTVTLDLLVALLDEVGAERAGVVGFSFGGGVAPRS